MGKITVQNIYDVLADAFPMEYAESWDNAGFLVGSATAEVTGVLIALDITKDVIREAKEKGLSLIVSHHPVIFRAQNTITDAMPTGSRVINLIENRINAICMHTNADCAPGGVNDKLAELAGLKEVRTLGAGENGMLGRYGVTESEMPLASYLAFLKEHFPNFNGVRYADGGKPVRRVAVGGGACGELIYDAKAKGCDTLITADVKHNFFIEAAEIGVNLIDAGHFETEDPVTGVFLDVIRNAFPGIRAEIAENDIHAFHFFA